MIRTALRPVAGARRVVLRFIYRAPVAQLDRASGYEPEGREFESPRARHFFPDVLLLLPSIPKLQNSLVWIAAAGFLLAVKAVNRQRSGWSLALKAAIQTHENAVQVPIAAGLSR